MRTESRKVTEQKVRDGVSPWVAKIEKLPFGRWLLRLLGFVVDVVAAILD